MTARSFGLATRLPARDPLELGEEDELVEDLTVVRVPDCGHFVTWQAPAAVNSAIDAFLS